MNRTIRQFDTIIVSGGNIEDDFALDFIGKTHGDSVRLIGADRGMEFFFRNSLIPDLAIGDFDSIGSEAMRYMQRLEENGLTVIRLRPQKDDTDTQAAFFHAVKEGAMHIALLGCTGTRLDHVMGNLGLLAVARDAGREAVILDSHNRISLIASGTVLKRDEMYGRYVSFFPFGTEVRGLILKGFVYPLTDFCLKTADSGLTVSNELAEDKAVVEYTSGNLLMIETRD